MTDILENDDILVFYREESHKNLDDNRYLTHGPDFKVCLNRYTWGAGKLPPSKWSAGSV